MNVSSIWRKGAGIVKRFGKLFWLAAAASVAVAFGAVGRAEEALKPLNAPTPFSPVTMGGGAGENTGKLVAAQSAQELGFSSLAVSLYRELLRQPGGDRAGLTLALATTLLEAGDAVEAEKVLRELAAPRGAAWRLRVGLAAMQLKKRDVAQAEWDATKWEELPAADLPWYWFLQGALWDTVPGGDSKATDKANESYSKAENAPGLNDLARARFQLWAEEVRFRRGEALSLEQLRIAKLNYEANRGTDIGYGFARSYALGLLTTDQKAEAMRFLLTVVLPGIPPQDRRWWNDFRLMIGWIGDRGQSFEGRKALGQILATGNDARRQRQALQLLWEASNNADIAREQLRTELDRMIGQKPSHPILESLLYYRAQLALWEGKYDEAVGNATRLLEEFPGSALRMQAYGLLTQLAWKQERYRRAADNARKARDEMATATEPAVKVARGELAVLEAEAWFRAGTAAGDRNDFRNAADTYAAALRERPANVAPGDLILQRVLSEIKAGAADKAAEVLDEMKGDPALDVENRWRAEWSLAREWQIQQKIVPALERVTKLLGEKRDDGTTAKPALVARMKWLQARLSFEAKRPEQAVAQVDALLAARGEIDAKLAADIESTALLTKANAEFTLWKSAEAGPAKTEREAAALATLQRVGREYSELDAAAQADLIESAHYEELGQIVEAQKRLTRLTDNHKESVLAPYAYFQLALLSAERLGQEKDLKEANNYIEELVNSPAAKTQGDLVYRARLKQGEIFMKLNDYPSALRAYEDLKDKPAPAEYSIMARLGLAMCHNTLSTTDPGHLDRARSLFDELHDRIDASADVRVEAGYNLGLLHVRRSKPDEAVKVWWEDVVARFLIAPAQGTSLGPKAPYWLGRTLIDVGDLYVRQEKLEEAKVAYRLILQRGLPFELSARTRLEKLGVPTTRE
ncbi:MAG: tetratricopeptide repeat protein [Opitutaceae bacterium]